MGAQVAPFGCAVLGAADILNYSRVASLIAAGAFVVCADGGLRHCRPLNLTPDLVVGDFDSLATPAPDGTTRIPLSVDKDYTDSFHAAQTAAERGYTRLLLAGMLGGRLDHTLANLQLLALLAQQSADCLLTDGGTDAYALSGGGELCLPARKGCYFSVLALEQCENLSIIGGKYPLEGYTLRCDDPRAISNEFVGADVRIRISAGVAVAVSTPI